MLKGLTRPDVPVALLIVTCFLGGFINLAHVGAFYPATIAVDALWLWCCLSFIVMSVTQRGHVPIPPWAAALVLAALVYGILAVVSPEPIGSSLLAWRSHIGYALIALYVANRVQRRELLARLAMALAVGLAAFGIVQTHLTSRLPPQLLASADTEVFGYFGTDISRANGLIGNTIVFGTVLGMFLALHAARWLIRPTTPRLIGLIVLVAAVAATYSRAAMISGVIAVIGGICLISWRRNAGSFIAGLIVGLPILGIALWSTWPWVSSVGSVQFITNELFAGSNATVKVSNATHARNIELGQEAFQDSPLIGVGINSHTFGSVYGQTHPVITDGALWARLADGGLLLIVSYGLVLGAAGLALFRRWREDRQDWLPIGLLVFMAYQVTLGMFVNSAIFGKVPFVLFWVMFGLATASGGGQGRSDLPVAGQAREDAQQSDAHGQKEHRHHERPRKL